HRERGRLAADGWIVVRIGSHSSDLSSSKKSARKAAVRVDRAVDRGGDLDRRGDRADDRSNVLHIARRERASSPIAKPSRAGLIAADRMLEDPLGDALEAGALGDRDRVAFV